MLTNYVLHYATRPTLGGVLAGLCLAISCLNFGCAPPPPPEGQLAIENVAKWYQLYRADNRGKAPANEEALVQFVQKKMESRGEPLDVNQLLTSPRDKKKYVIQYGKPSSAAPERNVAVYEQDGYNGKKLVAFESAWSREVDETELKSLLATP